jgi:hypothetical protein
MVRNGFRKALEPISPMRSLVFGSDPRVPMLRQRSIPLSTALLTIVRRAWWGRGCGAIAVSRSPAVANFPGGLDIDNTAGPGKPEHKKLRRRARKFVSRRRLSLGP